MTLEIFELTNDIVKVLLLAIGSSYTDRKWTICTSFHRNHHSVKLNVRLLKWERSDSRKDFPIIGWYKAIICND